MLVAAASRTYTPYEDSDTDLYLMTRHYNQKLEIDTDLAADIKAREFIVDLIDKSTSLQNRYTQIISDIHLKLSDRDDLWVFSPEWFMTKDELVGELKTSHHYFFFCEHNPNISILPNELQQKYKDMGNAYRSIFKEIDTLNTLIMMSGGFW